MFYVEVILPVKLPWCPVYATERQLREGTMVRARLGRKEMVGVVWHNVAQPELPPERILELGEVLDWMPAVSADELKFWEFISDYYMCSIGEVFKFACPLSKIKCESNAHKGLLRAEASEEKRRQAKAVILQKRITALEARLAKKQEALDLRLAKDTGSRGKALNDRLAADIRKTEAELAASRESLDAVRNTSRKSLDAVLGNSGCDSIQQKLPRPGTNESGTNTTNANTTGTNESAQNAPTTNTSAADVTAPNTTNANTTGANRPAAPKPHVIVSADRTAAYVKAIGAALEQGRQALVLAPEKAFIEKLRSQLSGEFREHLHIYSSDTTMASRRRISQAVSQQQFMKQQQPIIREPAMREQQPVSREQAMRQQQPVSREQAVVIGTRSALFLPYRDLGVIIVDEEQDQFYKQTEPAPRIHARDAAIALASIHKAAVILGSASPSFETLGNCISGKFTMEKGPVTGNIEIIDVSAEKRKNGMNGPVSKKLVAAINATDGPVTAIRCWEDPEELDFTRMCPGKKVNVVTMPEFKRHGICSAELLVLLQADAFLSKDDFRADERALQMIRQLSSLSPRLIVQTAVPGRFDGSRSQDELLAERKAFALPPYSRIVDTVIEDSNIARLERMANGLSRKLNGQLAGIRDSTARIRVCVRRGAGLPERKREISAAIRDFETTEKYFGHILTDVDPI